MIIDCKNTYWDRKGKYQKQYELLWNKLVLVQIAQSDVYPGELFRCMYRVYSDVHGNGGRNFNLLFGERLVVAGFLEARDKVPPQWLTKTYECTCEDQENMWGCDFCEYEPEFTQTLIDELEHITNIVIEFVIDLESTHETN